MSLPHVLMGLLHESPKTGYDLARAIREEMDPAWSAGFSQIYPALARLRRRGWVLLRVLGPRHGPRRLLYRVTAAGRRELARWLGETPAARAGNDPALARVALLDALPPGPRREALAAAEGAADAEVDRLRRLPPAAGARGLARRAAIERQEAVRRVLRTSRRENAASESGPAKPGRVPKRESRRENAASESGPAKPGRVPKKESSPRLRAAHTRKKK